MFLPALMNLKGKQWKVWITARRAEDDWPCFQSRRENKTQTLLKYRDCKVIDRTLSFGIICHALFQNSHNLIREKYILWLQDLFCSSLFFLFSFFFPLWLFNQRHTFTSSLLNKSPVYVPWIYICFINHRKICKLK